MGPMPAREGGSAAPSPGQQRGGPGAQGRVWPSVQRGRSSDPRSVIHSSSQMKVEAGLPQGQLADLFKIETFAMQVGLCVLKSSPETFNGPITRSPHLPSPAPLQGAPGMRDAVIQPRDGWASEALGMTVEHVTEAVLGTGGKGAGRGAVGPAVGGETVSPFIIFMALP